MMDFVSNLFKKSKEKNTCLKKEAEICSNQNKNLHLFDMESSFLQNSVLAPVEFNTDQNVVLNESIDTNQENLNPRYSVLNTFDPIINKEPDEILLKSQIEGNPSDSTNEQSQENIDDSFGDTETFVNDIIEDYLENAFVLTAAKESVISYSQDLNSSGSQNSNVLDTTKLLDGTFIVDVAPKLTNASDNDLVKENVLDSSNYSNDSHNVSSTLSTDTIVEVNLNNTDEQNISTEEQTLVSDNKSIILNDSNLKAQNTPNITQANDSLVSQNENGSFDSIGENERSVEEEHINEHLNILDSTHENSTTKADELIAPSTQISEELHMSATEPISDLKDSEETSATCTNEMGEIINQNECFEKQSDISNSTIDNIAECEKYKMQIIDLKEELKSCRQKTVTLETEVIDFKRKENELNVILKEYKQTNMSKDEQLKYLQANEEVLKNEIKELRESIKQYEINLKELQRKDSDEHDEQFKNLKANEETLKNEIKELKALIKQQETQSHSELQIGRVMEEYEKSISSLITENEKMKKERDTAQMHLANIEMAFSDVHQKYERCKAIVQGYKDNEESFKQDIAMNRETIVIQEQKYETLKAHAMGQLEKSNQELAAMKKQHETEMARLTAQLKRYEIKNMSLMESLQQKAKECEQLSAVCDEFIGNV